MNAREISQKNVQFEIALDINTSVRSPLIILFVIVRGMALLALGSLARRLLGLGEDRRLSNRRAM